MVAFDIRQELPFRRELLADREGNLRHSPKRLVGLRGLVAKRFFQEVERPGRQLLAEAGRLGDRQLVMPVDAEHDLVPEGFTRRHEPFGGSGDRLARLEPVAALETGQAHRRPAGPDQGTRLFDHAFARCRGGRGKRGHPVALLPAKKIVNGNAQGLPLDVVQGDVDRGHGRHKHAAAFEILAAVEPLPDEADPHGIETDKDRLEMLERPHHGAFPERQPAFAPAEDARIGFDLEKQLVPTADPSRVSLEARNPHSCRCLPVAFPDGLPAAAT